MVDAEVLKSIASQLMTNSFVKVEVNSSPVRRTSTQRLRTVGFSVDGHEYQAIEQNPEKPSRWGQRARSGHQVVQVKDRQGDPIKSLIFVFVRCGERLTAQPPGRAGCGPSIRLPQTAYLHYARLGDLNDLFDSIDSQPRTDREFAERPWSNQPAGVLCSMCRNVRLIRGRAIPGSFGTSCLKVF